MEEHSLDMSVLSEFKLRLGRMLSLTNQLGLLKVWMVKNSINIETQGKKKMLFLHMHVF